MTGVGATPGATGLEPPHDRSARSPFLGRELEIGALLDALPEPGGQGAVVLVTGEPGIGKSRLAEELAARARGQGAQVHWGRSWEASGAPPYWPWVQVIRSQVRSKGPAWARHVLGGRGALLAPLVPELAEPSDELAPPVATDPDLARFRLFDAVAALLRAAAQDQPLVVILDDLHAADAPSLLLLQYLAGDLQDTPVELLALYRSTELRPGNEIAATDVALQRLPGARRLALSGLAADHVDELLEQLAGRQAPLAVLATVRERAEGNPLFVGEIARLLATTADEVAAETVGRATIPVGILDAIGRRLDRLGEPTAQLLSMAAVLGREFSIEVLARMTDRHLVTLLDDLDEVMAEGLVTAAPGGVGNLRFSHDLVRECLYHGLGAAERIGLHLRAGEVLEDVYGHDRDSHLAELAHHFHAAAPDGDLDRAVRYARRAGEAALGALAYEEAARMYRMALQLVDLLPARDDQRRGDLLIGLGDAEVRAGDLAAARRSYLAAADLARRAALPEVLARAALGYGGRFVWVRAGADHEMVRLLEDALAALDEGDSPLRVRVLARLIGALRDQVDPARRDELSRTAVEMGQRLGDPSTLAYALNGRFGAIWTPERVEERLVVCRQLTEAARAAGNQEEEIAGHLAHLFTIWEIGDLDAMRSGLATLEGLAQELGQPAQRWTANLLRAALALFEGRFDEAETLGRQAYDQGKASLGADAEAANLLQQYLLARERDRLPDIEPRLRRAERELTGYFHFGAVLAHLHAELGRTDEARVALRQCLGRDAYQRCADNYWLLSLGLLAEVAAATGDPAASTIYDLMLPHAELNALGPPEVSIGLVHRPLGVLAAGLGRWEAAAAHFEAALSGHARMGGVPWLAWTRHQYGMAIIARGDRGDAPHARELLVEALATATDLGMTRLGRDAAEGIALLDAATERHGEPSTIDPAATAVATGVFRREGDHWMVSFEARSFHLKDTLGMRYLAALLAVPGRDVPALDLVAARSGSPRRTRVDSESAVRSGGAEDPVLDRTARAAYEARLRDLDDELRESEEWGDSERASRAREEMDFIARELAEATGLSGRSRQAPDDAERARQSVKKAISAAIGRIGRHSPALERHLAATITTGYACRYTPDPRLPSAWQL